MPPPPSPAISTIDAAAADWTPSDIPQRLIHHPDSNSNLPHNHHASASIQAARSQSAQLRSLHAAALLTMHAPFNNLSPATSRAEHHLARSAHDYPVFTPSYEEFLLASKYPGDGQGRRSVEVKENLFPLALDHSDGDGFEVASTSNLLGPQKVSSVQSIHEIRKLPTAKQASQYTSSQIKRAESRPHHITAIHPIRAVSGHKFKLARNKSGELTKLQADLNSSGALRRPLSEFLTEIAAKKNTETRIDVSDTNASADTDIVNKKNALPVAEKEDHGDRGCLSGCDKCLPGSKVIVVPLMDSRDYTDIPPKERDFSESATKTRTSSNPFSWFYRAKKKQGWHESVRRGKAAKYHAIPSTEKNTIAQAEEKDLETAMAMNSMEREVSQANKKRDAALVEVLELRLAIEKMGKKLQHLEQYCHNMKHSSERRGAHAGGPKSEDDEELDRDERNDGEPERLSRVSTRLSPSKKEFYHAVTEARVGVKQFCRILLQQIQERSSASGASDKIDAILQPYNIRVAPRVSKSVRYHLESLINQTFYEHFENIKFQRSGTHCILDPRQRIHAFYKTYHAISQLSWSELLTKDSTTYSDSFDRFCDLKMNRLEKILIWNDRWPDELGQAFFVAARWIWLLHLLAFSFETPVTIFRVGSEAEFDPHYMEELPVDQANKKQLLHQQHHQYGTADGHDSRQMMIRAMVMPGFFLFAQGYEVIKCKVLCRQQAPS